MSLIIDNKKIAGLYKAHIIQNSTSENAGIIRIATDEEVIAGINNLTAVTPKHLATKQNVLIAGEGLEILPDGTINNTQTSAEWGKIIGDISTQEDLNTILLTKSNISETAYQLEYIDDILTLKNMNGEELSSVRLTSMPDIDKVTIDYNTSGDLQVIGEITRNNIPKYTWIGTQEEYDQAKLNGIINEFTECLITDSEAEIVTPIVNYDAPTKLSELANDMNFVIQSELQNVKDDLQNQIDTGIDDSNLVHKTGTETIDGFKQFKEKIVIENTIGKGRIAHKPIDTSLEDGYIEFGDNTLIYGKQDVQGEIYDEKHDIFHNGNLIGGNNVSITKENNIYKIDSNIMDSANIDLSNLSVDGELRLNNLVIDRANISLSNLNEEGINIIKKNSGGGLEIGDIGIAPLGIDETKGKRRYLNGQVIIQDQYVQFTNKVKSAISLYPTLACTEEEWQTTATMTVGGQVGKFVVDNEAGTIRLPKIIMPIQGLTDLSKLAEIVEAGLPNITGEIGIGGDYGLTTNDQPENSVGALYRGTTLGRSNAGMTTQAGSKIAINASRSSSIYGNSDTVQQEQIQYPYFIQVATGAETEDNIINEIELNNPYSFGDSKYSPVALNNLSWLKSEGQYNPKAIYPDYYDWLLKIYNGVEVVEGISVKLSTEEYTDYDFVLNTEDETFRLPLLNGSEDLPSSKFIKKIFTTVSTTWQHYTCLANGFVYVRYHVSNNGSLYIHKNNSEITGNGCTVANNASGYIPVCKGDVISIAIDTGTVDTLVSYFEYAQGNGSLYFYVGETVQNANLINAGRIEEKIASIIPNNSSLIAGYAMPSTTSITLSNSLTEFTAQADGYLYLRAKTTVANGYVYVDCGYGNITNYAPAVNYLASFFGPVRKGQKCVFGTGGATMEKITFRYAVGSESEAE